MRVAVAGATGFVGRVASRALEAAGHDVMAVPRSGYEAMRADALLWAAGRREADPAANLAVHADLPIAVSRALGVARVIYLSSGECYGDAPIPYREDGPARGTSAYALAKLAGERAVGEVATATVLRLGVVYGPGQAPSMMIPQLVAALRRGEPFALTQGTQTRDFVFVDDVGEAIVAALAHPEPVVLNIASGRELRVRDACTKIADTLGVSRSLLRFGEVAMRPGEAARYVLDVTRARELLGWQPRTSFADGAAQL